MPWLICQRLVQISGLAAWDSRRREVALAALAVYSPRRFYPHWDPLPLLPLPHCCRLHLEMVFRCDLAPVLHGLKKVYVVVPSLTLTRHQRGV